MYRFYEEALFIYDPVLRKTRRMTDGEEDQYLRKGYVLLTLPRTTPGTMRFVRASGTKTLTDVVSGVPAQLKDGMRVIVTGLPARFCRIWNLPRRETYDATVARRRDGMRCLLFVLREGSMSWDRDERGITVEIPIRQLNRRAEIVPAAVL